jgi:hypothetical protein
MREMADRLYKRYGAFETIMEVRAMLREIADEREAEEKASAVKVSDKKIEEALDIFYGCIHWRGFGKQGLEGANGVKERMRGAIESAVHTAMIPDALGHSRSMLHTQYVDGWNACRAAMLSDAPSPEGE